MTDRFKSGAPLRADSIYIERPADLALARALLAGEICHVFGPRQLGKSSLYQRCARLVLGPAGIRCATLDLTAIVCEGISAEEFFFSLSEVLARELGTTDPLPFWQAQTNAPAQRWTNFLREVVIQDSDPPLVLFIDEIDKLFDTGCMEDFLTALSSIHESCPRFTFCLVGVAAAWELSKDTLLTNSFSRPIELLDFTRQEANGFLSALANVGGNAVKLLQSIYDWTAGHPSMTQRLGGLLEQEGFAGGDSEVGKVGALVQQYMLVDGRIQDGALNYAERHFSGRNPGMLSKRIELYRRLLENEAVAARAEDPVQIDLWLAGMATLHAETATLRLRSKVFTHVFNRQWLDTRGLSKEPR